MSTKPWPESKNPAPDSILAILKEKLSSPQVEIVDESHLHAGHKASGGGGHYLVTVVSTLFEGKSPLERHQAVYAALREKMKTGEIHALSLKTYTPTEYKNSK